MVQKHGAKGAKKQGWCSEAWCSEAWCSEAWCSAAGQQGAHTQNPLTRAAHPSLRATPAEVPATRPLGAGPGHRGNKFAP